MAAILLSPATTVDDATIGTVAWTNPNNAQVSDNVYATSNLVGIQTTHFIKATNFGFSIPATSTIIGIVAEVEAAVSGTGSAQFSFNSGIFKSGGAIITPNRMYPSTFPSAVDTYYTLSTQLALIDAPTDLWGTTWTASDVNNAGFGLAIAGGNSTGGGATANWLIDHIRITVYYTSSTITGIGTITGLQSITL